MASLACSGISKRGDTYLRTLLIHGARAVVKTVGQEDRCPEPLDQRVGETAQRQHRGGGARQRECPGDSGRCSGEMRTTECEPSRPGASATPRMFNEYSFTLAGAAGSRGRTAIGPGRMKATKRTPLFKRTLCIAVFTRPGKLESMSDFNDFMD